jgi:hypothetical protein
MAETQHARSDSITNRTALRDKAAGAAFIVDPEDEEKVAAARAAHPGAV